MLKLSDSYLFDAPRDHIWPLIFDPQSLLDLIPGCERIDQTGPDEYLSTLKLSLGAIQENYQVQIKILEEYQPRFCRMHGEVNGKNGIISGETAFELQAEGKKTSLNYQGSAVITGALGKINARFMEGVIKTLIRQGLNKLQNQLTSNEPVHPN